MHNNFEKQFKNKKSFFFSLHKRILLLFVEKDFIFTNPVGTQLLQGSFCRVNKSDPDAP